MSDAQQRLGFLSRLHSTSFRDDPAAARNRVLDGWRARHADGEGRFSLYRARVAALLSAALEDGMLTLKWMVAKSCFRDWLILEW